MRKLSMFNQVSLDGHFADLDGGLAWAHKSPDDTEWNSFVSENAGGGGCLVFGRVTYQMMASYWPTPMAMAQQPRVAEGMNRMPKVVFSRTLKSASWANTQLIKDDPATAMRAMKSEPGSDMAILGSGSIVVQLAEAGLIDQYQIVVNPLVLGKGRPLFAGLERRLDLRLVQTRAFANGSVVMSYVPR